jgi:hypothetical protein
LRPTTQISPEEVGSSIWQPKANLPVPPPVILPIGKTGPVGSGEGEILADEGGPPVGLPLAFEWVEEQARPAAATAARRIRPPFLPNTSPYAGGAFQVP